MSGATKSSVVPFIVFYGQEEWFLDQDIERSRAWKGRAAVLLDGEGMPDHEVVSICETAPTDGLPRVVIVDNANRLKGDKALARYIEEKSPTDASTVLVAIIRSEKLPEVWSKAGKKGRVSEYKKLKTWDSNNEVVKWLESEVKGLNRRFAPNVAMALFNAIGHDLHKLSNEIRKLCLIVPSGGSISIEDVRLVVAPSPTSDPFQIADAVMMKDMRKAMNGLAHVYRNSKDEGEANIFVVSALIKALEKTFLARHILDRGGSDEDVATRLSMHPWRCKTQFIPQVKRHSSADLARHLGLLCRLDMDIKGPLRSKRTLVELAVVTIAS